MPVYRITYGYKTRDTNTRDVSALDYADALRDVRAGCPDVRVYSCTQQCVATTAGVRCRRFVSSKAESDVRCFHHRRKVAR